MGWDIENSSARPLHFRQSHARMKSSVPLVPAAVVLTGETLRRVLAPDDEFGLIQRAFASRIESHVQFVILR